MHFYAKKKVTLKAPDTFYRSIPTLVNQLPLR